MKIEQIYNEFAKTYDDNRKLFDMTDVFSSFYNRLNVKQGRLLDLGCGAGEPFDRLFVDHGWNITGVDVAKNMLELASRYVPEMKTIQSDMRDIEFVNNQFDAITSIYSLFHIPTENHLSLFKKFYRWLKPGGKVLFTYATKEYTGHNRFNGYKEFMGQELFYSHKNPQELYADLHQVGFAIESKDYRKIGGETFLWVTVSKE
ncbi:MAG: methyltransferase domain-containing protein [Kiritimatiellae bacterium]|jgi:cyclopropane fatty-acyl-phospholipid synthase-like methyltransferase|nr:methyltransferase domain-containing protein [Kiritimatiellia bacterium]